MTLKTIIPLMGAAFLATSLPAAAQDSQWRFYNNGGYEIAAAYGGSHAEDTLVQLSCAAGAGGVPVVNAWIVANTDGYAEGTRGALTFSGPAWSVTLPVTVNGPGLYASVSATITYGPADTVYRSLFTNTSQSSYSFAPQYRADSVDFSAGRNSVVAFFDACQRAG